MNNTSKTIRQALKAELNLTSRDVSVTTSGGGTVNVTIKRADIEINPVHAIAIRSENIYRDGFGEILQGGNTFVFVRHSTKARTERLEGYLHEVETAMAELKASDSKSLLVPIGESGVLIGIDSPGYGFRLWKDGTAKMHANTARCAAAMVADYIGKKSAGES